MATFGERLGQAKRIIWDGVDLDKLNKRLAGYEAKIAELERALGQANEALSAVNGRVAQLEGEKTAALNEAKRANESANEAHQRRAKAEFDRDQADAAAARAKKLYAPERNKTVIALTAENKRLNDTLRSRLRGAVPAPEQTEKPISALVRMVRGLQSKGYRVALDPKKVEELVFSPNCDVWNSNGGDPSRSWGVLLADACMKAAGTAIDEKDIPTWTKPVMTTLMKSITNPGVKEQVMATMLTNYHPESGKEIFSSLSNMDDKEWAGVKAMIMLLDHVVKTDHDVNGKMPFDGTEIGRLLAEKKIANNPTYLVSYLQDKYNGNRYWERVKEDAQEVVGADHARIVSAKTPADRANEERRYGTEVRRACEVFKILTGHVLYPDMEQTKITQSKRGVSASL